MVTTLQLEHFLHADRSARAAFAGTYRMTNLSCQHLVLSRTSTRNRATTGRDKPVAGFSTTSYIVEADYRRQTSEQKNYSRRKLKEMIASCPTSAALVPVSAHRLHQMHGNATKRSEEGRRLRLRSIGMQCFHTYCCSGPGARGWRDLAQLLKTKRWRIRAANLHSLFVSQQICA